jgi:hypothetical protein
MRKKMQRYAQEMLYSIQNVMSVFLDIMQLFSNQKKVEGVIKVIGFHVLHLRS